MNTTQFRKSFFFQFLVLALSALLLVLILTPAQAAPDATFVVDSMADVDDATPGDGFCDDGGGNCTLRAAISEANALSGADTITLPAGTYTLNIAGIHEDSNATGDLDVTSEITINGAGESSTIIQAGTTDSNGIDRVFHVVDSGSDLTLDSVTLRHGKINGNGGGIYIKNGTLTIENSTLSNNWADKGGGVYIDNGALTLNNSTLTGNSSFQSGGGVGTWFATVNVNNSTLTGNSAGADGGGVYNWGGTLTTENSTFSGNSTTNFGGGIYISEATVNLAHCTLTDNTASDRGGGVYQYEGTMNLKNTIVAGNADSTSYNNDDCFGSITSQGYNLVGDGTGCSISGTGDQTTSDPKLGPLQDNGGPTETHALQFGSLGLDAIPDGVNGCGTDYNSDQRGETRPYGEACDVGAYESDDFVYWDGGGSDNNTSTPANWSDDTLPTTSDFVVFGSLSSKDATVDSSLIVAGWWITSDYTGAISQGSHDLTVSGIWMQSGGTFTGGSGMLDIGDDFDLSLGTLTAPSGLMTVNGGWVHSGGTFIHNNGTVTFNGSGTQTYSGTNVFYDVTVESSSMLQLATDSDFGYAGTLTLNGSFDATSNSPNTVRISGSGTQTLPTGATTLHSLAINSGATLSAPTSLSLAGDWSNDGTFTHNNGTITFDGAGTQTYNGTTIFHDVTVESGSALQLATDSDFGYAGIFTLNGSFDVTTNTPNTVRIAGSGTQSLPSGMTSLHSLAINSGATLSAPSTLSLAGDWSSNGTLTHNNGTVTFNGSGTQTYSGTTIFYDVTVEGGISLQLATDSDLGYAGSFTLNGSLDVTTHTPNTIRLAGSGTQPLPSGVTAFHSLAINSGAALSAPSPTLYIAGDWTNNGGFAHNSQKVEFNGSGAQTISGNTTFYNLEINNTSASEKVDASGSALSVDHFLAVPDGIFRSASDYAIVSIGSNGTLELSGDITVSGQWTNYGALTHNNHHVTFDGSGIRYFDGTTLFYDVTVGSSATLQMQANSELSLAGALIVDGTLDARTHDATLRIAGPSAQILSSDLELHHLVIDSGGALTAPSGDLNIAGNWTDNGVFHGNGGTVIFDGSGTQTMNGDTVFHNLTVEGGSTLQLATNAVLGYSGRIIADGTLDLLTYAPTTLMVSGSGVFTPPNQTTHDLVINDSLLGYWKLDEGSGSTVADSSGYGHDGTMYHDTTWVTDTPSTDYANPYALSFDGSGDYVDIPNTPEIDDMQQFTIAAWIKLDSTPGGNMRFVTLRNEKAVLRYDDTDLHFFVKIDGTIHNLRATGALSSTGTWMHVAGSYDGSTMRLYLNGVEQASLGVSGTVATGDGIHLSGSETLNGWLDDVRIYNRVLDESEFSALANGEHPLGTYNVYTSLGAPLDVDGDLILNSGTVLQSPVAGYWKLDEGTGTTTADTSANSYDGTLNGGPVFDTDTPTTHFSNPYSLRFNDSDDFVDIPSTTDIDSLQSLTIAAWVKLNSFPGHSMRFVTLRNEKAVLRYENAGTGRLDFYMKDNVGTLHHLRVDNALSTGTWIHVAGVNRGGSMSVYVNGVWQGSETFSESVAVGDGIHLSSSGETLDGWLDDVRVYGQALEGSEIQALAAGYDVRTHDIHVAGDFVRNGGDFEAGGGTITFDGSGTQTLDTDAITFHNMTVNSGSTLVDLAEFTVEGALTNNGALQKTQDVNGSSDVNFFDTGGYGGLTLNASGSDLGATTVTIKGDQDCTNVAGETVRRCFDIAPANTTGRNATVTFYFADSELSGNTCSTLDAYHWNGGGWDLESTYARSCISEPYSIQSSGVSDFSPFSLTSDSGPTAVTLRSFTVQQGAGEALIALLKRNAMPLMLLSVVLVLLLAGCVWLINPHILKKRCKRL